MMICEIIVECKGIAFRYVNCDISHDFKANTLLGTGLQSVIYGLTNGISITVK